MLIIEHDAHGAFGFILNKKLLLERKHEAFIRTKKLTFMKGGPVKMTEYFLVKGKTITSEYLPIDENFYLTEQQEEIVSAIVNQDLSKKNSKYSQVILDGVPSIRPEKIKCGQ